MKIYLIPCLLLFTVFGYAQNVQWYDSYFEAIEASNAQNKPIVALIVDGKSKRLEKRIVKNLFNADAIRELSNDFIFLKVNTSNFKSMSTRDVMYANRLLAVYNYDSQFPAVQFIPVNKEMKQKRITEFTENTINDFINYLKNSK